MRITLSVALVTAFVAGGGLFPLTGAAAATVEEVSLPLTEAIAALPVADESRAGYERTSFKHWVDADRDGCSTRAEVLMEEAVTTPEIGVAVVLAMAVSGS